MGQGAAAGIACPQEGGVLRAGLGEPEGLSAVSFPLSKQGMDYEPLEGLHAMAPPSSPLSRSSRTWYRAAWVEMG